MKDSRRPFVIVFAHEKGGTGKSTLAIHTAVGLMYSNKNYKIGFIDLDSRQLSSWNFFENRKVYKEYVPVLNDSHKLELSPKDSKKASFVDDYNNLLKKIQDLSHNNFIILDVSGSYNNYMLAALRFANLLITPMTQSVFDIDALVRLSKLNENMIYGPFYEVVFNERKQRLQQKQNELRWSMVLNRTSVVMSDNSEKVNAILQKLQNKLGFSIDTRIKDYQIYKELCDHGLTIFDVPVLKSDMSMIKIKAHGDMDKMVCNILNKYVL